eukprot:3922109-Alexandrium_andersonii.AAC.1
MRPRRPRGGRGGGFRRLEAVETASPPARLEAVGLRATADTVRRAAAAVRAMPDRGFRAVP